MPADVVASGLRSPLQNDCLQCIINGCLRETRLPLHRSLSQRSQDGSPTTSAKIHAQSACSSNYNVMLFTCCAGCIRLRPFGLAQTPTSFSVLSPPFHAPTQNPNLRCHLTLSMIQRRKKLFIFNVCSMLTRMDQ